MSIHQKRCRDQPHSGPSLKQEEAIGIAYKIHMLIGEDHTKQLRHVGPYWYLEGDNLEFDRHKRGDKFLHVKRLFCNQTEKSPGREQLPTLGGFIH